MNSLGIIIKIHKWPVGSGEGYPDIPIPDSSLSCLIDDHCPDSLFFHTFAIYYFSLSSGLLVLPPLIFQGMSINRVP